MHVLDWGSILYVLYGPQPATEWFLSAKSRVSPEYCQSYPQPTKHQQNVPWTKEQCRYYSTYLAHSRPQLILFAFCVHYAQSLIMGYFWSCSGNHTWWHSQMRLTMQTSSLFSHPQCNSVPTTWKPHPNTARGKKSYPRITLRATRYG